MRIIHTDGFSPEERKRSKITCIANTIISMKTLVENAHKLEFEIDPSNKVCRHLNLDLNK